MEQHEQGSQTWLEWRRQGACASETPILTGKSDFATPYQLWEQKLGLKTFEMNNFLAQKGHALEKKARAAYSLINDVDMPPKLVQHPTLSYIRASLDGFNESQNKVIEIKYQGLEAHEQTKLGKIPDRYIDQLYHQLIASQASSNDFVSFNDKTETVHIVTLMPDLTYQDKLIEIITAFWELVQSKTPPPLSDRDFKVIRDKDLSALFKEWSNCRGLLDHYETKTKELKKLIEAKLEHPRVRCGDVRVIKIEKQGAIKYKDIPELKEIDLEKYRGAPVSYFDFRVEKKKNE